MQKPIPFLILSDSPTSTSGLGRITRELALRIHEFMPGVFRVGCLGYGGAGSRHLPFPQYYIHDVNQWEPAELPATWKDFAGDDRGILFSIWDASRLLWLTHPNEHCKNPALRQFLLQAKLDRSFKLWTYSAIDAEGPNGRLSVLLKKVFSGFDRILVYSEWSARLVERTLENGETIPSLPHGIYTEIFHPRTRDKARNKFGKLIFDTNFSVAEPQFLVGIVATNQARKDFATAIQAIAAMQLWHHQDMLVWIHTDTMERYWSISALLHDYGLQNRAIITTGRLSDDQMAWAYSACDITFGIGLSEGFGYPIYESLACGTPCIHGNYGGGAEWLPKEFLIEPVAIRQEGMFCSTRPVFTFEEWVKAAMAHRNAPASLPAELDWVNLWPRWQKWLTEGVE